MKKYFMVILTIFSFIIATNVKAVELPDVTEHEIVTIYLFRGSGCSHCYDFLEYFVEVYQDYEDYFEIVAYESWNDAGNNELMYAVKEYFGETADDGVPFIVIGDDFYQSGFSSSSGETIIEEALEAYQDDDYTDIVSKIIDEEGYDVTKESISTAAEEEGIDVDTTTEEKGLSDGVIIGIIFGVVILGFGALVIFSRK